VAVRTTTSHDIVGHPFDEAHQLAVITRHTGDVATGFACAAGRDTQPSSTARTAAQARAQ